MFSRLYIRRKRGRRRKEDTGRFKRAMAGVIGRQKKRHEKVVKEALPETETLTTGYGAEECNDAMPRALPPTLMSAPSPLIELEPACSNSRGPSRIQRKIVFRERRKPSPWWVVAP